VRRPAVQLAPPPPSEMQKRAARLVERAPRVPLLGVLINAGVGLTGALLALLGYEASLAMFGGMAFAAVAYMAASAVRRNETVDHGE
jgi:hypothetical protein